MGEQNRSLEFLASQEFKIALHRELLRSLDSWTVALRGDEDARKRLYPLIVELASNLKSSTGAHSLTLSDSDKERLSAEVLEEVFRLGPLEPLA